MIIVALDNEKVFNEIKENIKTEVYKYDIQDMESVIEMISKKDEVTLITRDNLNGRFTKEIYIKQIKLANKNVKVILLTNNLTEEYKEFLFANKVFNVIVGDIINIDKIIEIINSKDNVIYKTNNNSPNVIKKQFISVFGTSGSGKSYISSLLSKRLSKLKMNTMLVDMDFQNSCQDIYNSEREYTSTLNEIINDIDKERDISNIIKSKINDKVKLNYILSDLNIFEYKNKINSTYYKKIYEELRNQFDAIVIDLPSSPFLDVVPFSLKYSTKIIFVVNPNYISLRQSIRYLELLTNLYNIPKNKIDVIVNKNNKDSIPLNMIKNILSEYNVIEIINYNFNLEGYLNGNNNSSFEYNFSNIIKDIGFNYYNKFDIKEKIIKILKERKMVYDN